MMPPACTQVLPHIHSCAASLSVCLNVCQYKCTDEVCVVVGYDRRVSREFYRFSLISVSIRISFYIKR